MPQPVPPLTLLQEDLTVTTGCRISKVPLVCHAILMDSHDIQITALQLTNIAKLLDDITLCMDCIIGKPTSLRP